MWPVSESLASVSTFHKAVLHDEAVWPLMRGSTLCVCVFQRSTRLDFRMRLSDREWEVLLYIFVCFSVPQGRAPGGGYVTANERFYCICLCFSVPQGRTPGRGCARSGAADAQRGCVRVASTTQATTSGNSPCSVWTSLQVSFRLATLGTGLVYGGGGGRECYTETETEASASWWMSWGTVWTHHDNINVFF